MNESLSQRIKRHRNAAGLSQAALAKACGWKSQSRVGNYEAGTREPSLADLALIAEKLGVPAPDLILDFRPSSDAEPVARPVIEANAVLLGEISAWDDGDPLDEDDCEVPYYAEVEFAGGHGMTEVIEVADRKLRFSNATLLAAGVDYKSAAVARVRGRSMERLIMDGAAIGFDMSDTNIIDGEIYAFNHDGMLRTKYLYRLPGGVIRVSSENGDDYPDEMVPAEKWREEVKMLGRVFWWSTVRRSPRRR